MHVRTLTQQRGVGIDELEFYFVGLVVTPSFYLIISYLIISYLIISYFMYYVFYLMLFYFVLFYFILIYFILSYLNLSQEPNLCSNQSLRMI